MHNRVRAGSELLASEALVQHALKCSAVVSVREKLSRILPSPLDPAEDPISDRRKDLAPAFDVEVTDFVGSEPCAQCQRDDAAC